MTARNKVNKISYNAKKGEITDVSFINSKNLVDFSPEDKKWFETRVPKRIFEKLFY